MKLKILVIADDGYPEIKNILSQNRDINFILTLGDLTKFQLKEVKDCGVPTYGVYGNHCFEDYMEDLDITNLHLYATFYKTVTLGGFEGCVKYKSEGHHLFTQEESKRLAKTLPPVDLLVLHSPPYGINNNSDDAHIGLEGLREYVDRNNPKHLFHGHTYKGPHFIEKYKDTNIHYVHGAEVISIEV